MSDKKTHFGRAGEYFAMSELLLRGWNVAVPVVDIGDDVFVINDHDKTTWRVQVKAATTEPADAKGDTLPTGPLRANFNLSRAQLRTAQAIELFYMLMVRSGTRWLFLVIPRMALLEIRDDYLESARKRTGPGRRPLGDEQARTDTLLLSVALDGNVATGWDASLSKYLDQWPEDLPVVLGGPGSIGTSADPGLKDSSGGDPGPSRDPET
jgi:hypothetical protein